MTRLPSTSRKRRSGFVPSKPPISYDRWARSTIKAGDTRSILTETGWYSPFRQTHILNLIDSRWRRRARLEFDVVLRLQPWPFRLRERTHPFYPQPKRHKGIWGKGRPASRRGTCRKPNEHRRKSETRKT